MNAAIVTITMVWIIYDIQGVSSCGTVVSCSLVLAFCFRCPFGLITAVTSQGGCWFGSSQHKGYKCCRGLRIHSYAFLCNFSHERRAPALCSLLLLSSLSCNTTKIRTLVRLRGGQGIQAWTLRTGCGTGGAVHVYVPSTAVRFCPPQKRVL